MRTTHSSETTIHLDAVDCCALWHAVVHQTKLTSRWPRFEERFRLIQHIFLTSTSLTFSLTDESAVLYRAFAAVELQRLKEKPIKVLQCTHDISEHELSLSTILEQLPNPVTN